MKIKFSIILVAAIAIICGIGTTSYAFHDGGVARCESCHTMHNSFQQGAMTGLKSTTAGAYGTGNATGSAIYLLRGSDQSSTCLNCHEGPTLSSYHVSTDDATLTANGMPSNMSPGGDFGWLKINTTTSTSATKQKERHGHNILAADFGYTADSTNLTAPGSTYDATKLNCISCHNPHNNKRRIAENGTLATTGAPIIASGSYNNSVAASSTAAVGVYRFLGGNGYAPKSYNALPFTNEVPQASAPSTYNRSESASDTHVAYGSGMSQWCGNCHGAIYDGGYVSGTKSHGHPTNVVLAETLVNYNAYKKSGDMTGSGPSSYSSLVPVEMGTSDYSLLKSAATNTAGGNGYTVDANAKVMCLSCHRAHATGFESMARFYVAGTITDSAGVYTIGSGGTTTAVVTRAYNDRPATVFAAYQRTLCNKCHAKD